MQPPRVDLLHRALFDATSNISYPHESAVMTSNTSNIVFDDIFTISAIDKEGKKFDRVSRLYAHSKNYDMDLTLDYNVELYPLQKDQSFALALASSLARGPPGAAGGAADEDEKDRDVWRPDGKGRRGLEEDYDYVMYGKVSAPSLTRCPRGCPSLWLLPYIACYSHSCAIEGIQIRRRHSGNCVCGCLHTSVSLLKASLCRTAYASFGGLLMSLTGSFRHMTSIVLGDPVYILLRK
ncbi:hypothetical protein AcV5_004418 [Taiwanofungus camphoratus]|nr:hypothetical protein AcV5_004418 [Antrodia cinnamomea]